ncbi:MAG: histidine kinase [Clostridiales bacterium]|nr:histidine kinase [Clostridiales bacterium]
MKNCSYRKKLLITHLGIVIIVVLAITTLMTLTASQQTVAGNLASLRLLTEQATINFLSKAESIRQHVYTTAVSTGVPGLVRQMRSQNIRSNDYLQSKQDLIVALSKMLDTSALYDFVTVRVDDGECVSNNFYNSRDTSAAAYYRRIENAAVALLNAPQYAANHYGANAWVRTADSDLFLLRDVYTTNQLRHVGRIAVHIPEENLVSLDERNQDSHYTLLFYNKQGSLLALAGKQMDSDEWADITPDSIINESIKTARGAYAAYLCQNDGWQAIGLLPNSVVNEVQNSVLQSSALVALLGIAAGLGLACAVSAQLSGQISRLVDSMSRVEAGDLTVTLPVESNDEIGTLTSHFNTMTAKIQELVNRLVQEEANKRQAEYQNLEYEYRFLQWQINPHFIYNALETVNALAKMDGNDELCDMIMLLSAYFRRNAETMRKRFAPVREEFRSLKQYVKIYHHIYIYEDTLEVPFTYSPEAGEALIPTMMIQPLLENALVHGANAQGHSRVNVDAFTRQDTLVIQIQDNGQGMDGQTIAKLLSGAEPKEQLERTSLGVRNVTERMRLIYGSSASLTITSAPGKGTCVEMHLPLSYTEWRQPLKQE